MKKLVKRINTLFVVFDILIMVAIIGVLFFSFFSFLNIKVEKTEDYLNQFISSLKTIYFLAKIAIVHIFVNLAHHIFKKARQQIAI